MSITNSLGRVMPVDKGAYNEATNYDRLDMVHTADSTYVSLVDDNVGNPVTDTTKWQCYADGKPATEAAAAATAAAGNATAAAAAANAAAGRAPYIGENGNWFVWSVQQNQYVDSGVDASAPELTIDPDYTIRKDGEVFTEAIKDANEQAQADHAQYLIDHASIAGKANVAANAVAGHMATLDANGNPTESGISPEELARIDGYYETMGVGIAKNLEGRNDVVDSFAERTTGGDAEVSNGAAQMNEVAGRSQVWNQLVSGVTEASDVANFSTDDDETICAFTQTSATRVVQWRNVKITAGHKYLMVVRLKSNRVSTSTSGPYVRFRSNNYTTFVNLYIPQADVYVTLSRMFTADSSYTTDYNDGIILSSNGSEETYPIIRYKTGKLVQYFDLTLIFGKGNEPTTKAEFEAWLAKNIGLKPYYPYNDGTVLNAKMNGIESLGFNLLNPTTGKARIVGAYSDVYGNYYGITGTHGTLTFTSDMGEVSEITPDSDGKFLLETPGWLDVASAGADCAVFLWWDGTKTEYEEYDRNVGNFDATHIYGKLNGAGERVQVFPDGMGGIGSIKDVVRVEDGAVVARRRVGKVDMGSLTWRASSPDRSIFRNPLTETPNIKPAISTYGLSNVLSPRYTQKAFSPLAQSDNLCFAISEAAANLVVFINHSYTNTDDFIAAMSGVPLYYELATEQLYTDLVYIGSDIFPDGTPVTLPVNYIVNNWGIERMLPQNDTDVITTFPEVSCRYAIDAVEELNTHSDEIEALDAKKPNKSGSYPDMAVGSAKAIEGNNTKIEDFVFTPIQCADGLAQIKSVKGKSLVWNQLINPNNTANSFTQNNVTYTKQTTGTIHFVVGSGGVSADTLINMYTRQPANNGHKYLARVLNTNSQGIVLRDTQNGRSYSNTIFTNSFSDENRFQIRISSGVIEGTYDVIPILIDLTLMFGQGNEPTTVAEFEAMFPLPYYANNAGALISNKTEQVESVGFNQWDEEMLFNKGLSAQGAVVDANGYQASSLIPIFPSTNYFFHSPQNASFACYYNKNGDYIGNRGALPKDDVFTTVSGAYYMRFQLTGYGNSYNHDICINLSDPSRNGEYEPYKKNTVTLNLPTLTGKLNGEGESVVVFPNGLKSAGTAYDEIVGNKAIKRVVAVDMGTLTWTRVQAADGIDIYSFSSSPTGKALGGLNELCSKYPTGIPGHGWGPNMVDKTVIGATSNANVYVRDDDYTDAATFKAAMNGVMLYYELATPEEYILDEPIPDTFQAYKGGTLRQLPENTAQPTTAPMVMENVYAIDAVGILTGLPQNYMSKESMQAFLSALGTAMNGTWAMTWDDQNGRYAFTFTPNAEGE